MIIRIFMHKILSVYTHTHTHANKRFHPFNSHHIISSRLEYLYLINDNIM